MRLSKRSIIVAGVVALLIAIAAVVFPNFYVVVLSAPHNQCINNLRIIDASKHQWAVEHRKAGTDSPTWEDLRPYLEYKGKLPTCPSGGKYTIGPVNTPPTCSTPGDILPP